MKTKFLFAENFQKSIPKEEIAIIGKDIKRFSDEYVQNNCNIFNMGTGWYIREIKGNCHIKKVYKFRVNRKDRILFTFERYISNRASSSESVIFLEFCRHDDQIFTGRNIQKVNSKKITKDEQFDEKEDEFENYVNYRGYTYNYDYNTEITSILSIEEMEKIAQGDDVKRVRYYLNDHQYMIVEDNKIQPLFLFGSAGSGKTTVSIYKAEKLRKNNIKVGYFTYSEHLKKDVEDIFKNIKDENSIEFIEFNIVNEHILHRTKISDYLKYEEFEEWSCSILRKYKNLHPKDVWREIRGIIKGLVPLNWINITIKQKDMNNELKEYLQEKNYIDVSNEIITIQGSNLAEINSKLSINNHFRNISQQFLKEIYNKLNQKIAEINMLPLEMYLKVNKQYSLFDIETRNNIYHIACLYEKMLKDRNKKDENDIIRLALKNNTELKYDYIICDEVQDLTEIQTYYLFNTVNRIENIMFSGDYNQTINPTFFKTQRIESLYKSLNGLSNFRAEIMETNYRSAQNIVNFANKLKELKIKKIGYDKDYDYNETSIRKYSGKIFMIQGNLVSKERLSDINNERIYVDILVSNEKIKKKLENKYNMSAIYTVGEYKGCENKYIIGVNILSSYKEKLDYIIKSEDKINNIEYMYYFNLLYVFITRARDNIYFIEDDLPNNFIEYFNENFIWIDKFDLKKLELESVSTKDEHYQKGINLEKLGQYEMAIDSYKNVKGLYDKTKIAIKRCNALLNNKKGRHIEAALELMDIGEYKLAAKCSFQGRDYENALKALIYDDSSYEEIQKNFNNVGFSVFEVIARMKNADELNEKFSRILNMYMDKKIESIKDNIVTIDEITELLKQEKGEDLWI
ncbi:AAA family ATPase [Inconstantimicrobium porci]|uniref:AAA family ATPase n=1 Tax=Inconstantimicrobium porci TaxID=2652291 RepID=A0A7X2N0P0_9CLOT|nr:AAA family ATPase [Inconstantimicrobium porci]MSR92543.1 AAA family ATPase [Inconstantimicrobium porci]